MENDGSLSDRGIDRDTRMIDKKILFINIENVMKLLNNLC